MLDKFEKSYPNLRNSIVSPFVRKVNPNSVSFLAFMFAVGAGLCFYYGYFIPAVILVLLNGYFDIVDGSIARKFGTSRYGDFLDHSLDRLADVAIFLGLIVNLPADAMSIGYYAIIMILLVSYLGTEAQALTKKRLYAGFAGRADRLMIISAMGILAYFDVYMIFWGTLLLLILSVLTFIQRFIAIKQEIA